jgi:diacylglycerol kinase (ATP)
MEHQLLIFLFQEMEKKSRPAKHTLSSGGGLFRLKFRRPESRPRSSHGSRGLSEGCGALPNSNLNVQQWGNEDVAAWLDSLQLGEYRDDFISHDIRGPELLTLERRDLKELGIHKVGHIKRIQQAIWEIKENARA